MNPTQLHQQTDAIYTLHHTIMKYMFMFEQYIKRTQPCDKKEMIRYMDSYLRKDVSRTVKHWNKTCRGGSLSLHSQEILVSTLFGRYVIDLQKQLSTKKISNFNYPETSKMVYSLIIQETIGHRL